jgi:trigger factor
VKTSVERVDDTTVKLSITVGSDRVDAALDAAAQRLSQEVKVPGFRPGRVPRRVLETRLGPGAIAQEAARDALPEFYAEAATAEDLDVVSLPQFDEVTFQAGTDASFVATVEVRPEIEVPDYEGLQVAHPEWEVTDEEIDRQLDALRDRFAELETVERPARAGDFIVVSMTGEKDGQPVDEVRVEDMLYQLPEEAGGESDDSELHKHVIGAKAGDVLRFTDTLSGDYGAELAGAEVQLTALVKEVKSKNLPGLDDDFAITASEFDTLDELREDVRDRLAEQKRAFAQASLRSVVVDAVSNLVEVPLPSSLVEREVQFRVNRIGQQASQHGLTADEYVQAVGEDPQQVMEDIAADARRTVKAQLVVDAIGRQAGVQVTDADLQNEVARQAARMGESYEDVARFMTDPDRLPVLVGDAFRRRTIDHLLERVQVLSGPPQQEPAAEPAGEPSDAADGPEDN